MNNEQVIIDSGDLRKYRTELPNMVDDEMDPFQYRLYGHYKRVCGAAGGECREAVRTTAEKCKMSAEKVISTRQWLADNGWIVTEQDDKNLYHIQIVDRWLDNFVRYSERAVRNSERDALEISKQRKNNNKNKPIKKEQRVASATPSPSCDEKDSSVSVKEKQFIPPPVADTPPKELTEQQEWFGVACAIVGWDYQTLPQKERAQVAQTLGIIRKAGYSLEELKQFLPQVWYKDWRWVKNQSFPTLSQLKTEIGKVRAARVEVPKNSVPPVAPAAVGGKDGVYGNIVKW